MVIDAILSVLTGGATGLIGTLLGKVAGYFETKQKIEIMTLNFEQEVKLQGLIHGSRMAEKEIEKEIQSAVATAKMRAASYRQDASYGVVSGWVLSLLRMVRPIITLILAMIVWLIYVSTNDLGVQSDLANQVMFLFGMSVSWWFGDRSPSYNKR
jgi:hypothetical protein